MLAAVGVICRDAMCVKPISSPVSIIVRFVVRRDVSHSSERDGIVVVPSVNATNTRSKGPIHSIIEWFTFAVRYNVPFIGHAEDDAVIQYHTFDHVLHDANEIRVKSNTSVAIGKLEVYHWSTNTHTAHFYWSHFRQSKHSVCNVRPQGGSYAGGGRFHSHGESGHIVGPFPHLKGPLFFMDTNTVQSILRTPLVTAEAKAIRTKRSRDTPPWDDVFCSFALSVVDVPRIVYLNLDRFYSDSGPWYPISHKPLKHSGRVIHPQNISTRCNPSERGRSCSNATIKYCTVQYRDSEAKVRDIKKRR